jgi:hypothetical protein
MATLQNGNTYYVELKDPYANAVDTIEKFFSLDYARSVNNIGQLELRLPISFLFLIQPYFLLEVWRTAGGGITPPYLDMEALWIILSLAVKLDADGQLYLEVIALDANMILASRYVAYYTNSAGGQTSKTGFAGDLMKAVIAENVAPTANDYTGTANVASGGIPARGIPASLYAVQVNLADGSSISMSFSWRQVLAVFQDMADASNTAGIYIAFDTVTDGFGHLEFRTYANQRGNDHRMSTNNPIILDPYAGNLAETSLTYDYTKEATFVYAAGQGTDSARTVATSADTIRLAQSPFARRELFQDARQAANSTQVQDAADAALRGNRGQVTYDSKIIETPSNRYGIEYKFGDILPCQLLNQSVDCRLDKVHVSVSGGQETIDVRMQSVT